MKLLDNTFNGAGLLSKHMLFGYLIISFSLICYIIYTLLYSYVISFLITTYNLYSLEFCYEFICLYILFPLLLGKIFIGKPTFTNCTHLSE